VKKTRQSKILELISQYEIETQEELAKQLANAGFQVTQATVSRDIRELSLTKVTGQNGRPKYAVMGYGSDLAKANTYSDRYARVLQDGMVSMTQADNLVVIKTVSGMAMAVAAAIDALGIEEIAGCIAGDDTIMCAVKTAELVPQVMAQLK
jgi:transcriptional regulator of arginine metabolism